MQDYLKYLESFRKNLVVQPTPTIPTLELAKSIQNTFLLNSNQFTNNFSKLYGNDLTKLVSKINEQNEFTRTGLSGLAKSFADYNNGLKLSLNQLNESLQKQVGTYQDDLLKFNNTLANNIEIQSRFLAGLNILNPDNENFLSEEKVGDLYHVLDEVDEAVEYHEEPAKSVKSKIPLNLIFNLFFFFHTVLGYFNSDTKKALEELKKLSENQINQLNNIKQRFEESLEKGLQLQFRVCNHNNKVYKDRSTKSVALALVKKNQIVNIINIEKYSKDKKWIYITYIDYEFNTPQSGWVLKKYFDKID